MKYKPILKFAPLLFWILIGTTKLFGVIPLRQGDELISALITICITTSLEVLTFLPFYYWLLPGIIHNNKRVKKTIYGVILFMTIGLIWAWVYNITNRTESFSEGIMIYKASTGHTLLSIVYAFIVRLAVDWVVRNHESQILNKKQYNTSLKLKEAELKLLKAQIHPHFLFNTLNNLYGLTLEQSKQAPDVVLKISALLEYMLYKCNEPMVDLYGEIQHIKNYIDLEKIRYDDSLKISFKQQGDATNIKIAPLLLLPFIENAFKHGISNSSSSSWIEVSINIEPQQLKFCIMNSKEIKNIDTGNYTDGIGLKNVKHRLELSYKNNYALTIEDKDNIFAVALVINTQ